MKIKITALLTAFIIMAACLSGCGNSAVSPEETQQPAEETVSPSPSASPEVQNDKYALAYASFEPDDVVMTINGADVRWDEYYCWIYNICSQFEYLYGDIDWNTLVDDGRTFQQYVRDFAESTLTQYWVIEAKANELSLKLSEDDLASIKSAKASDAANYGGEEGLEAYLSSVYITDEFYDKILSISYLYPKIFAFYFGENGEVLSDEDTMNYISDSGYMHAKHILFMTVDSEGNAISDEEKSARLADAQKVLEELRSITDTDERIAKFDELMNELSEDTGLTLNPNGYYFLPGEMVEAFENATKELEENAISDIVESPFGYHIILRLPIDPDEILGGGANYTMRGLAASSLFTNMADEWYDSAEILYSDKFSDLDLSTLFAD